MIEIQKDVMGQEEMIVGRVYKVSFTDCCVAGNFTSRLIDTSTYKDTEGPYNVYAWHFANGVVMTGMDGCMIREIKGVEEDREFISRAKLESALKHLASYYEDRARVSAKQMKESVDCQSACDMSVVAARWEARRDGVLQVAENLDIRWEGINKVMFPHVKFTSSSYHSSYKVEVQKVLQELARIHQEGAETMKNRDSRLKCEGQEAAIYGVAEALGIVLDTPSKVQEKPARDHDALQKALDESKLDDYWDK